VRGGTGENEGITACGRVTNRGGDCKDRGIEFLFPNTGHVRMWRTKGKNRTKSYPLFSFLVAGEVYFKETFACVVFICNLKQQNLFDTLSGYKRTTQTYSHN